MQRWKPEEDAELRRLVADQLSSGDVAKLMGRSRASVKERARHIGLNFTSRRYTPIVTVFREVYSEQLNAIACDEHLADLLAAHPGGAAYVIEKPSKGVPLRFFPAPSQSYITSPAAIAAE